MRTQLVVPIAAALLVAACGPDLAYERDPGFPIPAGATWTWSRPDGDGLAPHDGGITPPDSIARMIAAAIDAELTSAGYRRTGFDSAQFVVHYHVGRRTVTDTLPPRDPPRTSPTGTGNWAGYGRPEELGGNQVTWDEGMIIVDVLPRDRDVVAWRGVIAGIIPESAEQDAAPALRHAIRRLMRGFP
jgi:hypothetical protein